jgi:hypothetical protein
LHAKRLSGLQIAFKFEAKAGPSPSKSQIGRIEANQDRLPHVSLERRMCDGNTVIMKPFEIFKAGTHTSSQGESLAFSDDDLAAIASGYDASLHHAPMVVGHPKQDAPAYGWVDGIAVKDGRLVATPADLDTEFSELVKQGKFRKVSAAFYRPEDKGNPTPGKWYLRHVGFLGAQPPAVKGLKPIEFNDDGGVSFGEIEFADMPSWTLGGIGRLFRGLREYLIEKDGVDAADKALSSWEIDSIDQAAADMRAETPNSISYSEPGKDPAMTHQAAQQLEAREADVARREAEIAARAAEIETRAATFAEQEKARRTAADKAFVEAAVAGGRLPVGLKGHLEAVFADLSDDVVTFSEGDDEVKLSPRAALQELVNKMPLPVATGEIAGGQGAVDFSDTEAVSVAIKSEMKKAKDAGESITPVEAHRRLTNRS